MILTSFLFFIFSFAVVGVLSVRQSRGTQRDYFLASQSVSPWLVGLSAVATNNSGYMFIGVIGYTYTTGLASVWLMLGWLLGDFVGSVFIHRNLRKTADNPEVNGFIGALSHWQGTAMPVFQKIAALLAFVFLLAYASAQLVAGSKALSTLLHWPPYAGAVAGALIVLLYCWAGGIRASIWTDAVQSFVMIFAMSFLLIAAIMSLGGFNDAVAALHDVPGYMDWLPKDLVVPGILGGILFFFGWFVAGFSVVGQPHIMVRFMALTESKKINQARVWYYLWFSSFYFMATSVGLLSRILLPEVSDFDAELALPTIALQLLHPVAVGLILAGVFAATMSTADSLVLSCSAMISSDLRSKLPSLAQAKLTTVIVTAVALLWALLNQQSVFNFVIMAWSTLGSGFASLLILLVFKQRFSQGAAIAVLVSSVATVFVWRYIGWNSAVYEGLPAIALALTCFPLFKRIFPVVSAA